MNKYRVKEGNHHEGGVTYTKGQVVESPHDLNALFPGKFKVIRGPGKAAPEAEPEVRRPAAETVGTKLRRTDDEPAEPADDDSDLADSAPEGSEDEDEGPPRSAKKKKKGHH